MTFETRYNDFLNGKDELNNAKLILNYLDNQQNVEEMGNVIQQDDLYKYYYGNTPFSELTGPDKTKVLDIFIDYSVDTCMTIINEYSKR